MKKILSYLGLMGLSLYPGFATEASANPARWGAIAYSNSTGTVGWGWGYDSQEIAEAIALQRCRQRANDCYVAVQVSGGCAALARGDLSEGIYGAGWSRGSSREEAERNALVECSKRTKNCAIVNFGCEL